MHPESIRFVLIALLAAPALLAPLHAAEPAAAPPPLAAGESASKAGTKYPLAGNVIARVDKVTMTITFEGKEKPRAILVTSQTRLEKAGKPAVFDDLIVGEKITGQLTKNAEGKEEAVLLYLGPRPGGARSPQATAPEKTPAKAGAKSEPSKPAER